MSLPEISDADGYVTVTIPDTGVYFAVQVWCSISPRYLEETFTSTVSLFANDHFDYSLVDEHGDRLIPTSIKLTSNVRDGPSELVTTSGRESEGPIAIPPNSHAIVRFRSLHREQDRDWYLVLIGAVVALGAALVVEAFRPYIERIGD
jgi:hypothetical protein